MREAMNTRIVIADSSTLALAGAEYVLNGRRDTQVIGTVQDADMLRQTLRFTQPDILVLRDRLDPLVDGLELITEVLREFPAVRLVVIGDTADGLLIRDLFALGVRGYLYTGDDLRASLLTAVDTVMLNRPYLSPTANSEYLIAMQSGAYNWRLNEEARAVLKLLAQGSSIEKIAAALAVTPRRVYWVRTKLKRRFGASTNEHLISRAAAEGFVYLSD